MMSNPISYVKNTRVSYSKFLERKVREVQVQFKDEEPAWIPYETLLAIEELINDWEIPGDESGSAGLANALRCWYNRWRLHPRRYALRQSIGALKEMTKRTFTGKTGDVWTWEETPEVVAALKQLHKTVVENRVNRPHNYEGPLYAPHPDIKKDAWTYTTSVETYLHCC